MDVNHYISSGIIELYVLGVATDEQVKNIDLLRKTDAVLNQYILDIEKDFGAIDAMQTVTPPPALKSKIWAAIQEESANEPVPVQNIEIPKTEPKAIVDHLNSNPTQGRIIKARFNRWLSAASVLLVLSLGLNAFFIYQNKQSKEELLAMNNESKIVKSKLDGLEKDMRIATSDDMEKITLKGVEKHPEAKAAVMWDNKTKEVFLTVSNLPKANEDQQYQLWAIVNGKPVDAGLYDENSLQRIQSMKVINDAQAFAITLEKKGGSENPTMDQMYVFASI